MPALAPVDKPGKPVADGFGADDGVDDGVDVPVPLDGVGDAVLASLASKGALTGVNLVRSDSAHIMEMGQSYAMKKSVTIVVRAA